MSKYQSAYNTAKIKAVREVIPEIDKEISDLEQRKRESTNQDVKKGIDARIKALKIKRQSYRAGDPVKEETQASVTTGSIGSSTMATSDGGTALAVYGSSHIYAPKIGEIASRKGDMKKKKKRKKLNKEFVEHYFGE
jgi:hypothetical protein